MFLLFTCFYYFKKMLFPVQLRKFFKSMVFTVNVLVYDVKTM